MDFWQLFSDIIGWIYFLCWSSSFYGQVYENWKVKHVKGIAFDFIALNLTGFLFLSIYSTVGYFFPDAHGTSGVTTQDIIFAYHAVAITLVTCIQVAFYYKKGDNKGVRKWCIVFLILLWGGALGYGIATWINHDLLTSNEKLNLWYVLGYEKLLISFVKYLPQVYLNYTRKSTEGWSIFNILMDFCGGLFSFLQILVDGLAQEGEFHVFGDGLNIVKFALSWIAMGFDCIFMFQHYVLYAGNRKKKEALLQDYLYSGPTQITPVNTSQTQN